MAAEELFLTPFSRLKSYGHFYEIVWLFDLCYVLTCIEARWDLGEG